MMLAPLQFIEAATGTFLSLYRQGFCQYDACFRLVVQQGIVTGLDRCGICVFTMIVRGVKRAMWFSRSAVRMHVMNEGENRGFDTSLVMNLWVHAFVIFLREALLTRNLVK